MKDLNEYVTKCQTILQNTGPGNDLLVYYPVFDLWQKKGGSGNVIMQDVHDPDQWLYSIGFGETAKMLWENGYAFDYISDKQLEDVNKGITDISDTYQFLLVPPVTVMPHTTLSNILSLAGKNLKVIFIRDLPENVPGSYHHSIRLDSLKQLFLRAGLDQVKTIDPDELTLTLDELGAHRLEFNQEGIHYIRKRHPEGSVYFISNLGRQPYHATLSIPGAFSAAEIFDPLTERRGVIKMRNTQHGKSVPLRLLPGKSLFLFTYDHPVKGNRWVEFQPAGNGQPLDSGWEIIFSDTLSVNTGHLASWTTLDYPWATYYSGEAVYRCRFTIDHDPVGQDNYLLDLGEVREMAEISINGKQAGKTWCLPHQLVIPGGMLSRTNELTVTVRNLDANRIILMDREGIPWKNFYDINFVDITYEPFDASGWQPLPSGLPGPVKIFRLDP